MAPLIDIAPTMLAVGLLAQTTPTPESWLTPEGLKAIAALVGAIVWPAFAFVLIFIFRTQLRDAFGRMTEFKIFGIEGKLKAIAASLDGLDNRVGDLESDVAKFAPTSAISRSSSAALVEILKDYSKYLKTLGLTPPKSAPIIHVEVQLPVQGYNAYYENGHIYVKPDHANPAKVIHEFNHGVLLPSPLPALPPDSLWSYSAIEAGVANYLTADFLKSPLLDDGVDLTKRTPIADVPQTFVGGQSEGGQAWGSYMWALREHYTSTNPTRAIVDAFKSLKPSIVPTPDFQHVFLKQLGEAGLDSVTVYKLVNP
jgi:hypothetical protein